MTSPTCCKATLLVTVLLFTQVATPPLAAAPDTTSEADLGTQLIEATQRNETARALELLDAGADIDSKTRYGATALFFAADKGNLELVKVLIERGADVNVTDTFYSANPVVWALFKSDESAAHRSIVLELLSHKADGAPSVLSFAVRNGDLELARAAVESGNVDGVKLRTSASAAREAGQEELADYLDEVAPQEDPTAAVEIPTETLESLVGDYKSEELGMNAKVVLDGGVLRMERPGQPVWLLEPTGGRNFKVPEAGLELSFTGRGGMVEGFVAERGETTFSFARVEAAAEAPAEKLAAAPLPAVERAPAAPWPGFRGPAISGIGDGQGAPTEWNGSEGRNVLWSTAVPGIGLSSPIVWGDRVFVTTAVSSAGDSTFRTGLYGDVDSVADDSEHSWKVYALDRSSGEIVWERTAAVSAPKVRRHTKSSHANPTPITDGRHLVVHFGSEGLFCYDLEGELLWKRDLGVLPSGWFYDGTYQWGFSSSPIVHDGLVIVQTDIQKGSFIAAFDLETGEERWRTARDEIPTWGTPNIVRGADGKAEIVTNGTTIRGYDPKTGEELWTLGPNSEVTVGSPIVSGDVAYVTGGYPPVRPIYAIRPGGRGDLSLPEGESSSERVVWSVARGGTYIPTPILYEGLLYMLHNDGRMTAHDAESGQLVYRARVGKAESFSSSPVAADGKLYLTSEEGKTYVIRSGPVHQVLVENELGEVVMASPAISDGMMIVRGMSHVFALGEGSGAEASSSSP